MNRIRRIRRFSALLTALTLSCLGLAVTGTAAFAQVIPPSGAGGTVGPATAPAVSPTVTRIVVAGGGLSGWQVALIAVGAAIVAAALTVLADRAWAARRSIALPA
jgi:hypothetical protein